MTTDFDRLGTLTESAATVGAPEVGWIVATFLSGIYTFLHFRWVTRHQWRASKITKGVVWTVFVLNCGFFGLIVTEQLFWTSTVPRLCAKRLLSGWQFEGVPPLFIGLVPVPVQTLLTFRAARFIPQRNLRYAFIGVLLLFILFGVVVSCFMCASFLLSWDHHGDSVGPFDYTVSLACQQWANAVIDLTISVSLASSLKKRVAGFSHSTDSLLMRLARNALQTATYTAVLALAGAVTASISHALQDWRWTFVPYCFSLPLPFSYGISLFTTLATRQTIEAHVGAAVSDTVPQLKFSHSDSGQHRVGGKKGGRRWSRRSSAREAKEKGKQGVWVQREEVQTVERDEDDPVRSEKGERESRAGTDEIV
ncbi:hypothetical protein JCM8547_003014 [Rhodosporidiobolus lusitaniae]